MLSLGALGFAQPWLLAALAALPALYWLLRLTPPAPLRIAFPPVAILQMLQTPEETPARTPLWLLLLRLTIAALVVFALARPILNPAPSIPGSGPVILTIDNGWAAAADWDRRVALAGDLLEQAERDGREVLLLPTAPQLDPPALSLMPAAQARERLLTLQPQPWPVDREQAARTLRGFDFGQASAVWLSDGIATDSTALGDLLESFGQVMLISPNAADQAYLLREPVPNESGMRITIERSLRASEPERLAIEAVGPQGEIFGREEVLFSPTDLSLTHDFALPLDLQNRVARLRLIGQDHAAASVLYDERWRRRTVGIATNSGEDNTQPLLAEDYYVERALRPYAELRKDEIETLLEEPLSLLVLTDRGQIEPELRTRLEAWMEEGGVLLRFAGPKLAAAEAPLVPVPLRTGDRTLGGALSWSRPLTLQPFDPTGPFAGLFVSDEVTISRQVLAQPGPSVADATLVQLEDGTPLVTGERRGQGWLILVHTTANTTWTNLPLSGLFVDMLRRLTDLGQGTAGGQTADLVLDEMLDAFGKLVAAPGDLPPLGESGLDGALASPASPPGLYGDPESAGGAAGQARQALNIQGAIAELRPLQAPLAAELTDGYGRSAETDLLPWLLTLALLLAMIDMLIGLAFRGLLPVRRPAVAAAMLGFGLLPAGAVANDDVTASLTADTRLAFVRTGISTIDRMSEAGLLGLGDILGRRTSIETGPPVSVSPGITDLALFPLLYWPMPPEHPDLPERAIQDINDYLRQGGMILFDTGDAARLLPGQSGTGPGERRLRQLLGQLDVPPLHEVPVDHTLTRSFYLLAEFPGRFNGQPLWVDDTPQGINDGVAGVIIGAHDWAAAWATDEFGNPLRPVIPGGERQREMARRFGVNVVMYALTGNYKTDQVHVPALLERLGQ